MKDLIIVIKAENSIKIINTTEEKVISKFSPIRSYNKAFCDWLDSQFGYNWQIISENVETINY